MSSARISPSPGLNVFEKAFQWQSSVVTWGHKTCSAFRNESPEPQCVPCPLCSVISLGYLHPPFSCLLPKFFYRARISYQLPKCSPSDFSLSSCYVAASEREAPVLAYLTTMQTLVLTLPPRLSFPQWLFLMVPSKAVVALISSNPEAWTRSSHFCKDQRLGQRSLSTGFVLKPKSQWIMKIFEVRCCSCLINNNSHTSSIDIIIISNNTKDN